METGGPVVIDTALLQKMIDESGVTRIHIANNLGVSPRTLANKLEGRQDFWWHEVTTLRRILRLTPDEFQKIFG